MDTETKMVIPELELAKAINNLASAISNFKMPTTVSGKELERAVKSAAKEAVSKDKVPMAKQVEAPVTEAPKGVAEQIEQVEQASLSLPQGSEEITLADLRAIGAKLKSKGLATKQVINGMGYEKLSSVPQERYVELKAAFDTLLEKSNGAA